MVSFFDNRNLCVDPLMHKQQLGKIVWTSVSWWTDGNEKRQSFWIGAWAPMAFAAASDDSCSSSKNTKHRHSSNCGVVVHFSINTSLYQCRYPLWTEQVMIWKKCQAGAIVGHQELLKKGKKPFATSKLHLNSDSSRSNILPYQSAAC
jgi:hypothetical protein